MKKKTIKLKEPSFIQSINISKEWCQDWEDDLISDEVLADRVSELIKTKNGLRGFFAYSLSDLNCKLLDRLPSSLIFKLTEGGEEIIKITIKNFIMSTAQIINHQRDNKPDYEITSKNISERCSNLLKVMDTNIVTKEINLIMSNIDDMSNSFDNSIKYDEEQKSFIKEEIEKIAQ